MCKSENSGTFDKRKKSRKEKRKVCLGDGRMLIS